MHRVPHLLLGNVFVIVAIDVAIPSDVLPYIDGRRAFKSAGRRRDSSEMISRQRVTA
jgi:hypothetical protein